MTNCFVSNFRLECFSFAFHLQVVFSVSSSYAFGSSFQIFLSTNNISYLWHRKFQQISTHAFCSWDDLFSQEGKTRPLCRPILSSREVQESLMQPFYKLILLQTNVGNFLKHENKSSYSDQHKGNLLSRRVSKINVYAVKRSFQQSSKLKFAKRLKVHVLSSS